MEKWLKLLDIFGLLDKMLNSISTELREAIKKSLTEWEAKAEATPNPLDDLVVKFVRIILNV